MKTTNFTLYQQLKYRFDTLMSKGIIPVILLLFAFAVLITLLVAFFLAVSSIDLVDLASEEDRSDFIEIFWSSTMHIIDQGTITGDTNKSTAYRIVMLSLSLLGILLISILVGLLNNGIGEKIQELRKGRSLVIEKNHIVILGWSSKIFAIINELIKANSNQKNACIVILANKDKIEMDDEISDKIAKKNIKIITRTGDPIDMDDLNITNHKDAKSILIVPPDEEDNMADAFSIKCILAVINHPDRKKGKYNIIAEIRNIINKDICHIIGKEEVTFTLSNDVVARIAVQTCLQSGLSVVYNQLLEYSGEEIYFINVKSAYGLRFGEALFRYENVSLIGIKKKEQILLNPPLDILIEEGDELICISVDDDVRLFIEESKAPIQEELIAENIPRQPFSTKILILGWNKEAPVILGELDNYTSTGSEVCIVTEENLESQESMQDAIKNLRHLKVSFQTGIVSDRKLLNQLDIPYYNHVMILGNSKQTIQQADAFSLMTLMHIRNIKEQSNGNFTTVSEMLDIKNRRLAEVAKPDDFIISNHIVSLIMAQLAENKHLNFVFEEIFDAKGCEFYLKPANYYLKSVDTKVNFKTIIAAASRNNEIAIGFRIAKDADNPAKDYGIVLNPKKSSEFVFSNEDKIIVLAEEY